jgi:signal transduction histidine kinase
LLFTPEDQAAGVPAAELDTARAEGRASDERYHQRKDGSRFYCSGVTTRLGQTPGLGFAKIARDLSAQRQAAEALQASRQQLEQRVVERTSDLQLEVTRHADARAHVTTLLHKLVSAQEDQRARIARDLHDQLGQQLTALRLALEQAARHESNPAADDLARALSVAAALNSEVDFLAWELRPAVLDDLGLAAALPKFVREWSAHYGLLVEFRTSAFTAGDLTREAEVTFYRIAQEALNNVIKHANASHISVILETRGDVVQLIVEDDGVGFDTADAEVIEKGVGIVGMRERAALIGATLDIESAPAGGTTLYLRVPRRETGKPNDTDTRAAG